MEELFNNLESNDNLAVDEAKKELTKSFSQSMYEIFCFHCPQRSTRHCPPSDGTSFGNF